MHVLYDPRLFYEIIFSRDEAKEHQEKTHDGEQNKKRAPQGGQIHDFHGDSKSV